MHRLYMAAGSLTGEVIGAAIEVHRVLGPGLLESMLNFHETKLTDGVSRLILPGANHPD